MIDLKRLAQLRKSTGTTGTASVDEGFVVPAEMIRPGTTGTRSLLDQPLFPHVPAGSRSVQTEMPNVHEAVPVVPAVPGEKRRSPEAGAFTDPAEWRATFVDWLDAEVVFDARMSSGLEALCADYSKRDPCPPAILGLLLDELGREVVDCGDLVRGLKLVPGLALRQDSMEGLSR